MAKSFHDYIRYRDAPALNSSAQPGADVIDDFEDAFDEYSGDTGSFSRTTSTVKNGSNALEGTGAGFVEVRSTTGLDNYPSQGDTIRWWTQLTTASDVSVFVFGAQKEANRDDQYQAQLSDRFTEITIEKRQNGSQSSLTSTSFDPSLNSWYEFKLDWASDGTLTLTLFNESGTQQAQTSATDTAFSNGGIGWGLNNGDDNSTSIYYDYCRTV